jgi:hypothetical protein
VKIIIECYMYFNLLFHLMLIFIATISFVMCIKEIASKFIIFYNLSIFLIISFEICVTIYIKHVFI